MRRRKNNKINTNNVKKKNSVNSEITRSLGKKISEEFT